MEKTIKISEQTHLMLGRFGRKNETFDEIIMRLLMEVGEHNNEVQK